MAAIAASPAPGPPAAPPSPLRVLHVYSGNLFGGVERLLVTLHQQRQHAPGLTSEFALCFRGRLRDELLAAGAVVHDLPEVRLSRPWTVWRARRALLNRIARVRPDVCVTHAGWLNAVFAPAVRGAGAALVTWIHGPAGGGWVDRLAQRTPPDRLIVNSHFTRQHLPDAYRPLPADVIYCPVPAAEVADREQARRAVRAALGCPEGRIAIVCACRMEPLKGHALLLRGLTALGDDPSWECWIAGGVQRPADATLLADLHRTAGQSGLAGRVKFLGERRDVAQLFAAADLHCQPNTGPEPFGIAFVEALAVGLPVVTTRLGAATEIVVDDDCGLLTPPDNHTELAAALRRLIQDEPLRRRLSRAAPTRAAELCDPARRMRDLEQCLVAACRRTA